MIIFWGEISLFMEILVTFGHFLSLLVTISNPQKKSWQGQNQSGSPTHLLLEVSWAYTTPIGGEFFFPPFQRGQLLTKMASRVLIGFLNITGSHMLKHDVCSLTCLAACTPFLSSTRMQLLLEADIPVGFLISGFHISSTRMQLLSLLKGNASVFVELSISYFF